MDHNHSGTYMDLSLDITMTMPNPTGTPTGTGSPAATTSADGGHSGHGGGGDHGGMDMGGGSGCKMSMLLNYNTIDTCFLSSDWQITSTGMFAGSCIGVVILSIFLEFLRRSVKEWDRYLVRQHIAKYTAAAGSSESPVEGKGKGVSPGPVTIPPFRPSIWQQVVRALLHTAQFTVAYFIMLLGKELFAKFPSYKNHEF
jgi:copper transporter 1